MANERKYAVFGGVILLVLSVVLVFSGYMTQGTGQGTGVLSLQDSGTGNVVATGEIEIESIPAGANVYVDGINKNVVTPVSLSDLAAGTHTIKLTKTGYQDYIKSVSIVAGASTELVAYLNPTGSNGNLVVDSSVFGTNVYVNDVLRGRTPLTLNGIAPGTYNIRLVSSGYEPYITTAVVSAGQTTTVPYVVMIVLPKGTLNLYVNDKAGQRVSGASVYVDNALKGTTSSTQPFVVSGLAAYGRVHTLRIVKSGYTTLNDRFVTNDPRMQDWRYVQLVNVGDQGSIVVASNPVGASVYLDTETTPRGVTSTINYWDQSTFKINNVIAGTEHKITLKKSGYKDKIDYVVVPPTSPYNRVGVWGALNPLTPSTGSVTINARTYNYPGGWVDLAGTEVYYGPFASYYGGTPKTISSLNTGTNYTFVLRKSGYYDYVIGASPIAGQNVAVNQIMQKR